MSNETVISMRELEAESAELLPSRETLCAPRCGGHSSSYSYSYTSSRTTGTASSTSSTAATSNNIIVRLSCSPAWFARRAARPRRAALLPFGGPREGRRTVTPDLPDLAWPPRLANGTELLGEFKNSGVTKPPSLVRRADGQVIQLSRLVYLVASLLDGSRGPDVIAAKASAELGRTLSAEQVGYLITAKLAPLGIVGRRRARPPPCRRHGPCSRSGRGPRCCPRPRRTPRARSCGRCSAGR